MGNDKKSNILNLSLPSFEQVRAGVNGNGEEAVGSSYVIFEKTPVSLVF